MGVPTLLSKKALFSAIIAWGVLCLSSAKSARALDEAILDDLLLQGVVEDATTTLQSVPQATRPPSACPGDCVLQPPKSDATQAGDSSTVRNPFADRSYVFFMRLPVLTREKLEELGEPDELEKSTLIKIRELKPFLNFTWSDILAERASHPITAPQANEDALFRPRSAGLGQAFDGWTKDDHSSALHRLTSGSLNQFNSTEKLDLLFKGLSGMDVFKPGTDTFENTKDKIVAWNGRLLALYAVGMGTQNKAMVEKQFTLFQLFGSAGGKAGDPPRGEVRTFIKLKDFGFTQAPGVESGFRYFYQLEPKGGNLDQRLNTRFTYDFNRNASAPTEDRKSFRFQGDFTQSRNSQAFGGDFTEFTRLQATARRTLEGVDPRRDGQTWFGGGAYRHFYSSGLGAGVMIGASGESDLKGSGISSGSIGVEDRSGSGMATIRFERRKDAIAGTTERYVGFVFGGGFTNQQLRNFWKKISFSD